VQSAEVRSQWLLNSLGGRVWSGTTLVCQDVPSLIGSKEVTSSSCRTANAAPGCSPLLGADSLPCMPGWLYSLVTRHVLGSLQLLKRVSPPFSWQGLSAQHALAIC